MTSIVCVNAWHHTTGMGYGQYYVVLAPITKCHLPTSGINGGRNQQGLPHHELTITLRGAIAMRPNYALKDPLACVEKNGRNHFVTHAPWIHIRRSSTYTTIYHIVHMH